MKAIALKRYLPSSDPESLLDVELPDPTPQGRDLLVRVHAEKLTPISAANLRQAHAKLESGKMVGKLVLEGWR